MADHCPSKSDVAGSSPVSRSILREVPDANFFGAAQQKLWELEHSRERSGVVRTVPQKVQDVARRQAVDFPVQR